MKEKDKDFDSIMENEIGSIGGEEVVQEQENTQEETPKTLGKLNRIPGKQKELDEDEKRSLAAFMKGGRQLGDNVIRDNSIEAGWIPIDRSELGIRGQFYPEEWEFRIKPATVEAIKNWSSIDETNIAVTNNVFNEIIKACVSINTPTGKISWNKLNSWDRFWFILKVREYTFVNGEAAMNYSEECPECGADVNYDLKSQNLVYEFPDEDVVEKHWNAEDRTWYINPKEYDLDYPMVKLYIPTLEKDDAILQWAYRQRQQNKILNEPFLRFLPWLLQKCSKDEQTLERFIKECKHQFNNWDMEMFAFMDEVLRNITINPSEKLKNICPNCGEEVETAVQFPNGIKYLFAVQNRHKKFGSK